MQKYILFLLLSTIVLLLPSVYAMNTEEIEVKEKALLLADNSSINNILTVDDPIKFEILVQEIAEKHNLGITSELLEDLSTNNDKKLQLLKESMSELNLLHNNIISKKLTNLVQQAMDPWNRERFKGLGTTLIWAIGTGGFLGSQICLYFSDLNPNIKIVAGVPLITAAIASFVQLFDHANKTLGNTHINDKIENYLEKIMFLRKTKKNILEDIEFFTNEIKEPKKKPQSSEFEELDIN